ncbi:MAG: DUF2062 domain-containing protein [Pirellulaceae bacterium]|nr:DUF2062 domain-containing protein [Pirellulaceae bacterium]
MVKFFSTTARYYYNRLKYYIFHTVLHADDPPHSLALGIAIGLFVTFTPTVGFQMVLVFLLAWLFRANKAVGLPIVWISNPATIVPIFGFCYVLGNRILGLEEIEATFWEQLRNPDVFGFFRRIRFYWMTFMDIVWPLWVGSLVIATAVAALGYLLSYYGICAYRLKRWGQLLPPMASKDPPTLQDENTSDQNRDKKGGDTPTNSVATTSPSLADDEAKLDRQEEASVTEALKD